MTDHAAMIETLYRQHGPDVLRYLRAGFPRAGSPDDLLQETFVQAIRSGDKLAAAASPRGWLFAVARNVALMALRRRPGPGPLPDDVPAPVPPAVSTEDRLAAMRAAIAGLPEANREVVELRLRDDLSYDEIAVALGIPPGTVASRLHHAVQMLRAKMPDQR